MGRTASKRKAPARLRDNTYKPPKPWKPPAPGGDIPPLPQGKFKDVPGQIAIPFGDDTDADEAAGV